MIRDGFWLNYATMKWQTITEHETWIRNQKNADRIGVPQAIFARFSSYVPHDDRIPFLTWLLEVTPLLRIRGHLNSITFEFSDPDECAPLQGIVRWCRHCAGDFNLLVIRNFATGQERQVLWRDLQEANKQGKVKQV